MDLIRPAASPPEAAGRLISGKLSADDPKQTVTIPKQWSLKIARAGHYRIGPRNLLRWRLVIEVAKAFKRISSSTNF